MAAQTGLAAASLAVDLSKMAYPATVNNTSTSLVDQGDAYLALVSEAVYQNQHLMLPEELKPLKKALKLLYDTSKHLGSKKLSWRQRLPLLSKHNFKARLYLDQCEELAKNFSKTSTTVHCRLLELSTISVDHAPNRRHSLGESPFEDANEVVPAPSDRDSIQGSSNSLGARQDSSDSFAMKALNARSYGTISVPPRVRFR